MSANSTMKTNASSSTDRFRRAAGILSSFGLALIFLLAVALPACTTPEPEGEPIDMEAMRTFKPFELKGLDGKSHRLDEYLNKVTLVSFFFPT